MKTLQLLARFKIQPGKTAAFKALAASCIKAVQEKDKGTLQYEWYYNDSGSECVVVEKYETSDAFLEHMNTVGAYLGPILEMSSFSGEVYGNPADTVKNALGNFEVSYYAFDAGI